MSNHQEETPANDFEDYLSILNDNATYLETDAYLAVDNETDANLATVFSCLLNNMSSDSETEEKGSKQKKNKMKLNKSKKEVTKKTYNTRALSKHEPTYRLERFDKNLLIIFNQYRIHGYKEPRKGTMEDAAALIDTFNKYGFQCERYDDLTREKILNKLDKFSKRDFTDYGCVVVAVLTHGKFGGQFMAKDIEYNELDILSRLRARDKPTLVTKPIVLLIQACRGTNNTEGQPVINEKIPKDTSGELEHYFLPIEADTLVFHSSYVGKTSYRPLTGSWFIQTLCKKINELSDHHDLESIMTEVKREVACNKESIADNNKVIPPGHTSAAKNQNIPQPSTVGGSKVLLKNEHFAEHHKQMPTVTSALTRKLYLIRKQGNMEITPQKVPSADSGEKTPSDVADSVPSIASTYHNYKVESDPCLCFLDHLDYMKHCLRHYVADNDSDTHAQFLLKSSRHQPDSNTELAKFKLEAISHYLNKSMDSDHQKYMYFYETHVDSFGDRKFGREGNLGIATKLEKTKRYVPLVVVAIGTYVAMKLVYNTINK